MISISESTFLRAKKRDEKCKIKMIGLFTLCVTLGLWIWVLRIILNLGSVPSKIMLNVTSESLTGIIVYVVGTAYRYVFYILGLLLFLMTFIKQVISSDKS